LNIRTKQSKIAFGGIAILIIMIAFMIVNNRNADNLKNEEIINSEEQNISNTQVVDYGKMDLDKDGLEENISIENRADGLGGNIYLIIGENEYLIEEGFYEPNSKRYKITLDFLEFDSKIGILYNLSQYANGVGSNSFVTVYEYRQNEIIKVMDYSDLEEPTLMSQLESDKLLFKSKDGLLIQTSAISDIPEDKLAIEDITEIPEIIEDYNLSLQAGSKLDIRNGQYYLSNYRVIRGPIFLGFYEVEYLVTNEGFELVETRIHWGS